MYDALAAAVAQVRGSALGAARIVLLSDGDDVGSVTSLDAALSQLDAQKIRVYTVGIESPDFKAEDLQKIADETGGTYAAASSPEALTKIYDALGFQLSNEYLLRYRSTAQPDQNVDVAVAVKGNEPVSFSYSEPGDGDRGAVPAGVPRQALPVLAADPARSSSWSSRWPSSPSARSGASARTARSWRGSASSSHCLPKSRRASGGRKSMRCSPLSASRSRRSARCRGCPGSRTTSTSPRSSTIRAG